MSTLQELKITRKALENWTDNIWWGKDGSLYVSTQPEATVCEPVFIKEVGNQLKNLFHARELRFAELSNKFENIFIDANPMLTAIPEPIVDHCIPAGRHGLVAVVTKHANVILYLDEKLVGQVDNSNAPLPERAYHCLTWNDQSDMLYVGTEANTVEAFSVTPSGAVEYCDSFILNPDDITDDSWVVRLRYQNNKIVSANTRNEVYYIDTNKHSIAKVKDGSKSSITDIQFVGDSVYISSLGSVHCYLPKIGKLHSQQLDMFNEFFIIQLPDKESAVLFSNRTSFKLQCQETGLHMSPDEIISPIMEKKFAKWNKTFNEYHKYETRLCIRGIAVSPDMFTVAILYDIERISLKYSIPSEQTFRLVVLPLGDDWELKQSASGLAWYQTYSVYGKLPYNIPDATSATKFDMSLKFKDFISSLLNSNNMLLWRFKNFINDPPNADDVHQHIYSYIMKHIEDVENPLDMACTIWLSYLLEKEAPFQLKAVEFKGQFISEVFDFNANTSKDTIVSQAGHQWKRCSVTGLPLLSTAVRVCPVSKSRVIDITKDKLNEYGWLTATVLKTFGNISIFTGTKMTDV